MLKHFSHFPVDKKQSVTTAVFLNDTQIISSGANDGALKYWDIRKNHNTKGDPKPHHAINFAGSGPRRHGYVEKKRGVNDSEKIPYSF